MKFLNLTNLTIDDKEVSIDAKLPCRRYIYEYLQDDVVSIDLSLKANSDIISNNIRFDQKDNCDTAYFSFNFYCEDEMTEEEEEGFFETIVNLTLSNLFEKLTIKDKGRPRERRLGVPENIAASCNVMLALLKNAINYTTYYDIINIDISLNNRYFYKMINTEGGEN